MKTAKKSKAHKDKAVLPSFDVCNDVTGVGPSGWFNWNPSMQVVRMQPAPGTQYPISGANYTDVGPQGQTVQIAPWAVSGKEYPLAPVIVMSGKAACPQQAGNPKIKVS